MQKNSNKGGHQSFKTNGSVIPANFLSVVNLKLFFLAEKKNKKQNINYRMWCVLSKNAKKLKQRRSSKFQN